MKKNYSLLFLIGLLSFSVNSFAGGMLQINTIESTDLIAGETATLGIEITYDEWGHFNFVDNPLVSITLVSSTGNTADDISVTIAGGDLIVVNDTVCATTFTVPDVPEGTVYTLEVYADFGLYIWWGGLCEDPNDWGITAPPCQLTTVSAVVSGASESLSSSVLHISPNPVSNAITIAGGKGSSVLVTDLLGNKVLFVASNHGTVDVSELASGVYQVTILGNSNVRTATFIKE